MRVPKLKKPLISDGEMVHNNEIVMMWNSKSHHKIKISGIGIFSSNIHGIEYRFQNKQNPIGIAFDRIDLKKIVQNRKVDLRYKFIAPTEILANIEIPFIRKKIGSNLTTEILRVKHTDIKIEVNDIFFEFEPFSIKS